MRSTPLGGRDAAAVGLAVVLAASETAQVYLGLALQGAAVPWADALRATVPSWAVLLVLVLLLFRALDHLRHRPRRRRLLILTLVAPLFTGLHLAGSALMATRLHPAAPGFTSLFLQLFTVYFVTGLLAYVAVITLYEGAGRAQARQAAELAAARSLADRAQARVHALEGRLRPDFLFNTLNAVAGLVARGDLHRAVDLVTALGQLMRSSVTIDPTRPVPLLREMERVECYLAIQAQRFPDRIRVRPPSWSSVETARLPGDVLLPLVEAVVETGLDTGEPFEVGLVGGHRAGSLRITVAHTGAAPPPHRLDPIRRGFPGLPGSPRLEHGPGASTLVLQGPNP